MEKESGVIHPVRNDGCQSQPISNGVDEVRTEPRGWDALEAKLKARGLSALEIEDARKSFNNGIEVLSKMFFLSYGDEDKPLV